MDVFETHNLSLTNQAYNIDTFATKLGVDKIAKGATLCLFMNYIHAILTGALSTAGSFNLIPMIGGHGVLAAILLARFKNLIAPLCAQLKFTTSIFGIYFTWNMYCTH